MKYHELPLGPFSSTNFLKWVWVKTPEGFIELTKRDGTYPCDNTVYEVEMEGPSKEKFAAILKQMQSDLNKLKKMLS